MYTMQSLLLSTATLVLLFLGFTIGAPVQIRPVECVAIPGSLTFNPESEDIDCEKLNYLKLKMTELNQSILLAKLLCLGKKVRSKKIEYWCGDCKWLYCQHTIYWPQHLQWLLAKENLLLAYPVDTNITHMHILHDLSTQEMDEPSGDSTCMFFNDTFEDNSVSC